MVKRSDSVELLLDLSGDCRSMGARQRACRMNTDPAQYISQRFPRMGENLKSTVTVASCVSVPARGPRCAPGRPRVKRGRRCTSRAETALIQLTAFWTPRHDPHRSCRLTDDENRDLAVRQHFLGLTAQQQRAHAASTVGRFWQFPT
jgi:hypothetical protein